MQDVVSIVAPVFGLIALGFLLARTNILSEATGDGLTEFVFFVAAPALLFRMLATMEPPEVAPIGLWTSYFGAITVAWTAAALLTKYVLKRPLRDGAAIAMGAGFGNVVMLGIPLALNRFGDDAATPMALLLSINAPLLWFAGTLHIESAGQKSGRAISGLFRELGMQLIQNPIVIAVLAGGAWWLTGFSLPSLADKMISMVGQATVPVALIALGVSLKAFELKGQVGTVMVITALSLVAMPLVAWFLAVKLFALPPVWAGVAVLFAACPTGANAFVFASRYDAAKNSVSAAVALATALSAITVALVLAGLN